jgi:hypothetical protein
MKDIEGMAEMPGDMAVKGRKYCGGGDGVVVRDEKGKMNPGFT